MMLYCLSLCLVVLLFVLLCNHCFTRCCIDFSYSLLLLSSSSSSTTTTTITQDNDLVSCLRTHRLCTLKKPRIKPPTFWLVDDSLHLQPSGDRCGSIDPPPPPPPPSFYHVSLTDVVRIFCCIKRVVLP